jgi:endonuclease/exonuclease/phosphatase family metal-dependent hydrolase
MTWNIGGGYIRGQNSEAYDRYDLQYFINVLASYSPDVICLQEMQGPGYKQLESIRSATGYFGIEMPISVSHFDHDSQLMLGILSRWEFSRIHYQRLPNPEITAIDDDGLFITSFDNGFLRAYIGPLDIDIHCGHCLPFHRFHRDLTEVQFADVRSSLELAIQPRGKATVVCGDFNFSMLAQVLPNLIPHTLRDCLPDVPTTPVGTRLDHVLASRHFVVADSRVDPNVLSDHFPGWADLKIEGNE